MGKDNTVNAHRNGSEKLPGQYANMKKLISSRGLRNIRCAIAKVIMVQLCEREKDSGREKENRLSRCFASIFVPPFPPTTLLATRR